MSISSEASPKSQLLNERRATSAVWRRRRRQLEYGDGDGKDSHEVVGRERMKEGRSAAACRRRLPAVAVAVALWLWRCGAVVMALWLVESLESSNMAHINGYAREPTHERQNCGDLSRTIVKCCPVLFLSWNKYVSHLRSRASLMVFEVCDASETHHQRYAP